MYIFSPFVGCAFAGGVIYGENEGVFEIQQDMQYAIISHNNGIQKMLVTVNFDWEESNKTAWIFPVPSEPENIKIDIAGWTPKFRGRDIIKGAKDDLKKTTDYFFAPYLLSVVVPYPLSLLYFLEPRYKISSTYIGVEVYTRSEEHGIVAEVISANRSADIHQHLKNNGMEISEGMITQLDHYIEEDFSFIVTWISNHNLTELSPGLMIEFPTEKAFYPLVLSSIYGDEIIPIDLIIKGHVTPDIYDEIKDYCNIRYWDFGTWNYGENFTISPETDNFTREMFLSWDRTFTSIEIEAPSSAFTKDLWFEEKGPDNLEYVYSIADIFGRRERLQTLILIYFIFSLIISFNLGIIILGREMEDMPFFLIMGLGNMMGIMGLFIFNSLINKVTDKYEKFPPNKVALYIGTFIITFFISMWVLFTLLALPLS
jgi:hypothetical protein